MKFVIKLLICLVCINFIILLWLFFTKNKIVVHNPKFESVFNNVISNKEKCKIYNFDGNYIHNFVGKTNIFNFYSINNLEYKEQLNIIKKLEQNNINANTIDVIIDNGLSNIDEFIISNKIHRPIFLIKKEVLENKLAIFDNGIVITDININKAVLLNSKEINYDNIIKSMEYYHKKNKFIKKYPIIDNIVKKRLFDETITGNLGRITIINNFIDNYPVLLITDSINNNVFITYLNGGIVDIFGNINEKNNIKLYKPTVAKYINKKIYIVDSNTATINVINPEICNLEYSMKNEGFKDILDFEFINEWSMLISTTNGLFVYDTDEEKITNKLENIEPVDKLLKRNDSIYFLNNFKLYKYNTNNLEIIIDIKELTNNTIDIKSFDMNDLGFYFLDKNNEYILFFNIKNKVLNKIKIGYSGELNDIIFFNNVIYSTSNHNIIKINPFENNNIEIIPLSFTYNSKNIFYNNKDSLNIKDFEEVILDKNLDILKLKIIDNNFEYVKNSPSNIKLYQEEGEKLVLIENKYEFYDKEIIFNNIKDKTKVYYLDGELYYKTDKFGAIFIKKISQKIVFSENSLIEFIEI